MQWSNVHKSATLLHNVGHPFGDRRERGVKEAKSIALTKTNFA
jgi:hypothetical protein